MAFITILSLSHINLHFVLIFKTSRESFIQASAEILQMFEYPDLLPNKPESKKKNSLINNTQKNLKDVYT